MASEDVTATFHAILPYPPSVNHYWRHVVRRGRVVVYIADTGLEYRRRVKTILKGAPKLSGSLRVVVLVNAPDGRVRDLDNLLKCLLDSLTAAGLWNDDNQVDELAIVRKQQVAGGAVDVVVSKIQPPTEGVVE